MSAANDQKFAWGFLDDTLNHNGIHTLCFDTNSRACNVATGMYLNIALLVVVSFLWLFSPVAALAPGTVFTCAGRINLNRDPFTGVADLAPRISHAASGVSPIGLEMSATIVVRAVGGLFTASPEFWTTPLVMREPRSLQVGVRTAIAPFTSLTAAPRLTAMSCSINAILASQRGDARDVTGSLRGDVSGTQGASMVGSIGGPVGALVVSGVSTANGATSVHTWDTPVRRDGSGHPTAGAGLGAAHREQAVDPSDVATWCKARSEQAGKAPVFLTDARVTAAHRIGGVTPLPNWSGRGPRLLTEAERERAARNGMGGWLFLWGNALSKSNATDNGNPEGFSYDLGADGCIPAGSGGAGSLCQPVWGDGVTQCCCWQSGRVGGLPGARSDHPDA